MNVLIVYAHPEPRSLNGSLKSFTIDRLTRSGHDVRVSDLYAMRWKPALDAGDFPARDSDSPLDLEADSKQAYTTGAQPPEVAAQQADLRWADAVIFQFPLWWYSMPAILKGWVERVYAYGFAYGVGEHSDRHWGDRFGEGVLQGKRALLIVTAGGWESHYSERGVNGPIDDLLFPITRGILHYPGFDVLPSFVVYRAKKMDDERFARIRQELGRRLDGLWTDEPIAYRKQNGGDYEIPALTLKPGLEWAGVSDGGASGPRAAGDDRSASVARAADAGAARASGFRLHIRPRA
ncbi:NAD(P)H-dependent oxidoreductase [Sorangium sp. So ce291]|uniref:NAD(P)H-dependent oxidoreductase n=1 Tax=Sorangium sp. So ce291 TaxID=3133294 RepID=UPI003F619D5F